MDQAPPHGSQLAEADAEAEVVDAVVVSDARRLPAQRAVGARAQAAVVAGSFAVGAVTAVVVTHRRARRSSARASPRRRGPAAEIAASRSFLVDVHLLGRRQ